MKKLFIIALILMLVTPVFADKWVTYRGLKDVSIVALSKDGANGNYLFTHEDGRWFPTGSQYLTDEITDMRLYTVGTWKVCVNDKGDWNGKDKSLRWVSNEKKTKAKKQAELDGKTVRTVTKYIETKLPTKKITSVKSNEIDWNNAKRKTPPKNTPVLVKYKNDLLTVAYLNDDKEWRLNTDKDSMFADEIKTIIAWRFIK